MKKLRIPERFRPATIESINFDIFKLEEYLKENLKIQRLGNGFTPFGGVKITEVRGVVLSGPPGVGKTWTMAALTRWWAEKQDDDYEFVSSYDMLERYDVFGSREGAGSQAFRGSMDEYRGTTYNRTYETVPWLAINDLGKEFRGGKLGDVASHKLGRILRTRSERCLPVFITTNLPLKGEGDTLASVYGESITSLLREMTRSYQVVGSDLRRSDKKPR